MTLLTRITQPVGISHVGRPPSFHDKAFPKPIQVYHMPTRGVPDQQQESVLKCESGKTVHPIARFPRRNWVVTREHGITINKGRIKCNKLGSRCSKVACLARDLELDPRNPRTAGLRAPELHAKRDNSTNGENEALIMTSKRAI
uniref:Transposon protein, putative, unclassified n=1 Tax=Oryza sativa subsp. japonica TaxID=39947 RepID=Q10BF6_ORYSJ|nr:transposon protein, putative, unclassified [Oryza sativa Japonica Group]